jgi:hypothetical protein
LIAQSLICLRSCLEAIRVEALGFLKRDYHIACDYDICKIQCIANLDLNLTFYLDELSRVFFKKENAKNKADWYISAFYSFCIQAIVRKALLSLSRDGILKGVGTPCLMSFKDSALSASHQFLHLAIHLFIATSGTYDPLKSDYSTIDEASRPSHKKDLISLQEALGVPIKDSGEYLKQLFEIEEVSPAAPPSPPWNPSATALTDFDWYRGPPLSAAPFDPFLVLSARDQAVQSMAANIQRLEKLVAVATTENLNP